jgi:phosphatidylserine/phosphatidylglycerophosphate/cardiolipin synthase-like enzyme
MTKRRKRSKKKSPRAKKGGGISLSGLIVIGLIAGVLFIGDRAGLIDVDWQAFLNEIISENVDQSDSAFEPPPAVAVEPVGGEWYELYFTTPRYPDEPATRVDTIKDGLIEVINSAQQSLDIAIYELDLDEIGAAILAARDRGVAVRLVTDSDELEELETLIRLEEEGIPIVPDERNPIMHNKFVVVDNQAVWTGSWNFTLNGTYRNNNHAIYIRLPQLAENYHAEFEEMFIRHEFGPTSPGNTPNPRVIIGKSLIETCFAPEDQCADQLVNLIRQAQKSIHFMAFSFTSDKIGQAVRDRARDGVTVQGVFETRGSDTDYSEYGRMRRQKLDVVQDGNPYTLHHKVFIIDEETAVLGSFNFSDNADEANDENMLMIQDANIASQFLAEFDRVYTQAQNPPD